MATNENVNKVIYGNQTVMDITDTTAEESDVASGEVFYKANGARSVGTLNKDSAVWGNITGTLSNQTDLQTELNRAYTKTASETSSIDDLDLIPVQKISASSDGRRNIKFKNLKSILKTYFDAIYSTFSGSYNDLTNKPTAGTGIAINNNIIAVDADNTPTEGSEKPVKSKGVYSALESSREESTSLLKSTVGWTGKNLLPNKAKTQTINGVTFTVNADGSVTANGTATANTFFVIYPNTATNKYEDKIINGCPAGGNANTSYCISVRVGLQSDDSYVRSIDDIGNGGVVPKVDTSTEWIRFYIRIASGYTANNLTFYPMLRDASITDDTYEPYHESVEEEIEQIYADNGVLGAKNLLPFPYKEGTKTLEGVTFTVNTDGSVTANGTATNTSYIYLFKNEVYKMGKECFLNGCPANGSDNTYKIIFWDETTSVYYEDKGDGVVIPSYVNTHTITSYIRIGSGTTVNNLTFYPMLRLASDPDDTYVPYAMTNRELTEAIANIVTDDWTKTRQVQSDGTVTFTGLNDSYSYSRPYYDLPSGDSAYTYSKVSKSGSGTSVTLTYTTDAPSGTVCKLRILK